MIELTLATFMGITALAVLAGNLRAQARLRRACEVAGGLVEQNGPPPSTTPYRSPPLPEPSGAKARRTARGSRARHAYDLMVGRTFYH